MLTCSEVTPYRPVRFINVEGFLHVYPAELTNISIDWDELDRANVTADFNVQTHPIKDRLAIIDLRGLTISYDIKNAEWLPSILKEFNDYISNFKDDTADTIEGKIKAIDGLTRVCKIAVYSNVILPQHASDIKLLHRFSGIDTCKMVLTPRVSQTLPSEISVVVHLISLPDNTVAPIENKTMHEILSKAAKKLKTNQIVTTILTKEEPSHI